MPASTTMVLSRASMDGLSASSECRTQRLLSESQVDLLKAHLLRNGAVAQEFWTNTTQLHELRATGILSDEECAAQIQTSDCRSPPPEMLEDSLVGPGVLLCMGLRWFGGKITRRAQERTRDKYDYRVMLNEEESTHSKRLPIEEYDVDENAGVGAWVLLEPIALPAAQDQHVGVRRSGRTLTPNVRNIDQSC